MESIWSKTTEIEERESLQQDLKVQTAVIGGGMAGILTAFYLKKKGIEAVVLEADRIGSGQTRNTTAKITSQHNLIYSRLLKELGKEKAEEYARANQEAIEEYEKVIRERQIDCGFLRCPAYLYSLEDGDILKQEGEAARQLGISAEFTTGTALPFPVRGALRFDDQAQFHPLRFIKNIAEEVTVYERTKVEKVEGDKIYTRGGTVQAKHIVFACHYPFINMPGYYFARMHQERSYVLALEQAADLDGTYLSVDQEGLSLRNYQGLTLLGGGGHRTGENSKGGKYEMLREKARELWPRSRETARWSAQDCMTTDGIPFIGRFSESTPDWYVATGFGKWGMTTSMVSARILSEMIAGNEEGKWEVFSPQRSVSAQAAKCLLKEGAQAVKGLGRRVFSQARGEAEKLSTGHGGVVEIDGEKAGVYRDEEGEIYVVSIQCPHLGCQLEWNPDEKSWDCPCHGSRFDYRGNLLNDPAQEDLQ